MIHIATELKTSITYTGTGSQKLFDIPFDYLRTSFVKTNVDDIVLTYGEDYVIINRQIEFTVAPISGSHVVIYRETTTDRLVSWADASVLKASDMTINQVQQLHILEEQQDWTKTNSIVMEGTIGWNARFHRIINVGDPVEPQDAVTKQYVEDVKTGFISEMIKVKNSAITEITDIKNKAIEAINNLKASTETYLTQLKDTFKSFVTEKTEEVNSLKESADTSATTATKEADRAKKEADRAAQNANKVDMSNYYDKAKSDEMLANKADLVDGEVPAAQLPEGVALLNSPALSGTPTAPTAAKTVNNTQIATTAFVHLLAGAANNGGIVDSLLAQNGYVKFANGLIIQWGTADMGDTLKYIDVTYPIAFSNATYFATVIDSIGGTSDSYWAGISLAWSIGNTTKSTCRFVSTTGAGVISWMAIGS